MKPKGTEVSPYAYDMIESFNNWCEASSKKGYRFSEEEQQYLEQMISIMNNQINMLVDYELKRKDK